MFALVDLNYEFELSEMEASTDRFVAQIDLLMRPWGISWLLVDSYQERVARCGQQDSVDM